MINFSTKTIVVEAKLIFFLTNECKNISPDSRVFGGVRHGNIIRLNLLNAAACN